MTKSKEEIRKYAKVILNLSSNVDGVREKAEKDLDEYSIEDICEFSTLLIPEEDTND